MSWSEAIICGILKIQRVHNRVQVEEEAIIRGNLIESVLDLDHDPGLLDV